jgi:FkbM family methyltransferase
MLDDSRITRSRIEVVPKAVTDHSGQVTFFVLEERSDVGWSKESSSLNRRIPEMNPGLTETSTVVECVRLDEFLADTKGRIALWIDVEGAASQVIEGFRSIASSVTVIHVEVENRKIWVGQDTENEVVTTLKEMGFQEIGRSMEWEHQDNIVFVRSELRASDRALVHLAIVTARGYSWIRAVSQHVTQPVKRAWSNR